MLCTRFQLFIIFTGIWLIETAQLISKPTRIRASLTTILDKKTSDQEFDTCLKKFAHNLDTSLDQFPDVDGATVLELEALRALHNPNPIKALGDYSAYVLKQFYIALLSHANNKNNGVKSCNFINGTIYFNSFGAHPADMTKTTIEKMFCNFHEFINSYNKITSKNIDEIAIEMNDKYKTLFLAKNLPHYLRIYQVESCTSYPLVFLHDCRSEENLTFIKKGALKNSILTIFKYFSAISMNDYQVVALKFENNSYTLDNRIQNKDSYIFGHWIWANYLYDEINRYVTKTNLENKKLREILKNNHELLRKKFINRS